MVCKLSSMWKQQSEQQAVLNLDPEAMPEERKYSVAKDLLLGLTEKLSKLAKYSTHYKLHVLKAPVVNKFNVIDSIVDIMKYTISIAQLFDINEKEIYDGFLRKTEVIYDKTIGERLKLDRHSNVLAIDIDNVVADLSNWDKGLKKAKGESINNMGDKIVDMLESMKTIFYEDGGLLELKPIDGAIEGLRKLKKMGWIIVFISARPCWQYKKIRSDTIRWLKKYGVEYDLLLFNKDKAEAIREKIFPAMPAYMIEDKEKHAIEVAEIGVRTLLLSNHYNVSAKENNMIVRVYNWEQIVRTIGELK